MRAVSLNVGATPNGSGRTWAYPKGQALGHFRIPVYPLTVTGTDEKGQTVAEQFNVFRFGVQCTDAKTAHIVGLANSQTHVIKQWIPTYSVHSAHSNEEGAWQVYDNFLIHDGPDNDAEIFATIGCIEIMGPEGFTKFNDLVISLSGPKSSSRDDRLLEIGKSGMLKVTYQKAERPPLKRWP